MPGFGEPPGSPSSPPFSAEQRGFGTAPLSLRLLPPGASAALLWLCSGSAPGPASIWERHGPPGTGVGGEGQGRGQLYLELHVPCSVALGLALRPLPAWQPGSAWTHASGKQMPFQPLAGGSGAEEEGLGGCAGGEDPLKPPPSMGQERTPPSLPQQVVGQGGSTTLAMAGAKGSPRSGCTLRTCTRGPLSLHPPFAGAGAVGSDAQPWQRHRGDIWSRPHCSPVGSCGMAGAGAAR